MIHIDVEARKIDLSIRSAELETEVKEMEGYMGKSKKKDKSSQGGSQPNLGNFGSLLDELYSKDKK